VIARGQYKGGVGTSSITLDSISTDGSPVIVGAIAVVNALGAPLGLAPGTARTREERPSAQGFAEPPAAPQGLNTTLVVIATNAVLDVAECKRTASSGHAGLARALDPSHTLADGDTVFTLATGAVGLDRSTEQARQVSLITLQSAAAEAVRLAILDGVEAAESVTTAAGGFAAYRTVGE
jgi:L-aminopeptidase/D-esterase-like protein